MKSDILVTYFSHTGNTEQVAKALAQLLEADLCELRPLVPYPALHAQVVARARGEIREGLRPPLRPAPLDANDYPIVAVGTPNWQNAVAPPVATLLRQVDWHGKRVLPFCTHGGDGGERVFWQIARQCEGAQVAPGYAQYGGSDCTLRRHLQEWLEEGAPPRSAVRRYEANKK